MYKNAHQKMTENAFGSYKHTISTFIETTRGYNFDSQQITRFCGYNVKLKIRRLFTDENCKSKIFKSSFASLRKNVNLLLFFVNYAIANTFFLSKRHVLPCSSRNNFRIITFSLESNCNVFT